MNNWVDTLRVTITTIDRTTVGREWHYQQAVSRYPRLVALHSGCGHMQYGSETIDLRPGQLALLPPHRTYDAQCPDAMDVSYVHFEARILNDADPFLLLSFPLQVPDPHPAQSLAYLEDIRRRRNEPGAAARLRRNAALLQLLVPLLAAAENQSPLAPDPQLNRLNPVLHMVTEHPEYPHSVTSLARAVGLQPNYFISWFRDAMGQTPMQYVRAVRVRHVQERLWRSSDTLDQIADELGFCNAFHLSRVFKQHTGMSPSAFRRQTREGEPRW